METKMNELLSDLVVFYHKLQNFHWYVKGHTFFVAHAKLEEYYDMVNGHVDEVAEAMLMCNLKPVSTISQFTAHSKIKEAPSEFVGAPVVWSEVLADFKYLLESAKGVKEEADNAGNFLVSTKLDDLIGDYSKAIWMLSQSLD